MWKAISSGIFENVWHVRYQAEIWFDPNFSTSQYGKRRTEKITHMKDGRTFIFHNNNAEKLLKNW